MTADCANLTARLLPGSWHRPGWSPDRARPPCSSLQPNPAPADCSLQRRTTVTRLASASNPTLPLPTSTSCLYCSCRAARQLTACHSSPPWQRCCRREATWLPYWQWKVARCRGRGAGGRSRGPAAGPGWSTAPGCWERRGPPQEPPKLAGGAGAVGRLPPHHTVVLLQQLGQAAAARLLHGQQQPATVDQWPPRPLAHPAC